MHVAEDWRGSSMLNSIGRNLNQCFSRLMQPLVSPQASSSSSSANQDSPISPAAHSSSMFIKNFNSLYDPASDHCLNAGSEPDLATAFASRRFFFSSPGRSNSIVESSAAAGGQKKKVFDKSVAVPTFSPDPYLDFRRSMQEMVEARPELMDVNSNWEILHELLLCYLALNPKHTHKYIVGAFADLLVNLMPQPPPTWVPPNP